MNLKRKLEIVEQSIRSISLHHDEDAAVRHAALDAAEAVIKAERAGLDKRTAEDISAALGDAQSADR